MNFCYIVVCEDQFGLVQATRQYWPEGDEGLTAAQTYARTVAPSRKPQVVQAFHPDEWRTD